MVCTAPESSSPAWRSISWSHAHFLDKVPRPSSRIGREANSPPRLWRSQCQLPHGLDNRDDFLVVARDLPLELGKLAGKVPVSSQHFAKLDKCSNDEHAHFHGTFRLENGSGHDCAMFGKRRWKRPRVLELMEVVTNCDHLDLLSGIEREQELFGEPVAIALYGLIQGFCRHSVQGRKVSVDDDSPAGTTTSLPKNVTNESWPRSSKHGDRAACKSAVFRKKFVGSAIIKLSFTFRPERFRPIRRPCPRPT